MDARVRSAVSPTESRDADALIVRAPPRLTPTCWQQRHLRIVARAEPRRQRRRCQRQRPRHNWSSTRRAPTASAWPACLRVDAGAGAISGRRPGREDSRWEVQFVGSELRGKTLGSSALDASARRSPIRRAPSPCTSWPRPVLIKRPSRRAWALDCSRWTISHPADCVTLHLPSTANVNCSTTSVSRSASRPAHQHAAASSYRRLAARHRVRHRGAELDVFAKEPPADWSLARLPGDRTPHIAAHRRGPELVGLEAVMAVRNARCTCATPSTFRRYRKQLHRLQP